MRGHFGGLRQGLGCALALVCGLPCAGLAQTPEQPLLAPTRDVTVIYRLTGAEINKVAQKMITTYTMQGERVRIDYFHWMESKTPFTSQVFDRPANRGISIMQERRSYVERDVTGLSNPALVLKKGMQFTRAGSATLAGTPCTDWAVKSEDKDNKVRNVCVADDGLLLRLEAVPPGNQTITAVEVHYGSPPESIFQVPTDFTRLKPQTPAQR